jgi:hypothetical protein
MRFQSLVPSRLTSFHTREPSRESSKKACKRSRGNKGMAFMQSMFEAYVKSQKKAGKSKKHKKCDYDSSGSSDSE